MKAIIQCYTLEEIERIARGGIDSSDKKSVDKIRL